MSKPYKKLRTLMQEHGYDQVAIARVMLRSSRYVSTRLNHHASWELDDCYKILGLFGMKADTLPDVFPEGGANEADV